jgi:cytochrome oxidase Cu insertion factor (SCO1/SenC/PrrC family)
MQLDNRGVFMRNLLGLAGALALAPALAAQQPAAPPPAPPQPTPLAVGAEAPDFTLSAATIAGVSTKPVHLKDLRGKTVVLAFFFKARTGG